MDLVNVLPADSRLTALGLDPTLDVASLTMTRSSASVTPRWTRNLPFALCVLFVACAWRGAFGVSGDLIFVGAVDVRVSFCWFFCFFF